MRYYIVGHDNRGTAECPFGRIYLSLKKGGEVVGSIGYGQTRECQNPYAVWPTNSTPTEGRDPSLRHRAETYLRICFPGLRPVNPEQEVV